MPKKELNLSLLAHAVSLRVYLLPMQALNRNPRKS
jgi:hypothetical protein